MSRITRRHFLTALGLGGAGAAAAVLAANQTTPDQKPKTDSGPQQEKGYKVTAHVRNYYRTTRV
ncbi:MAG: twin-arginine translocation signal domain-containing protein [Burkholderiales bacterium]